MTSSVDNNKPKLQIGTNRSPSRNSSGGTANKSGDASSKSAAKAPKKSRSMSEYMREEVFPTIAEGVALTGRGLKEFNQLIPGGTSALAGLAAAGVAAKVAPPKGEDASAMHTACLAVTYTQLNKSAKEAGLDVTDFQNPFKTKKVDEACKKSAGGKDSEAATPSKP